jgi:hypothetical protein
VSAYAVRLTVRLGGGNIRADSILSTIDGSRMVLVFIFKMMNVLLIAIANRGLRIVVNKYNVAVVDLFL